MGRRSASSPGVVALTDPTVDLSEQQRIFVECIMKGMGPMPSARAAGYTDPKKHGSSVLKSEKVQNAIKFLHKKYEKKANMNRKRVMDGFLEAIEIAKLQAEPSTMVAGWREIGRMCGYYAPEVKKVDISISAKRAIDKMETLSDEELVKMIEEESTFIEGEAEHVLEEMDEDE